MNVNKVFLAGRITREIELRYTPSGTAVAEFGMAINRKFKDQEETTFVDCVAWARSAEVIAEYCKKGKPIFVEGRLTFESWEGRDGQKRSKLKVTVENFQFIGGDGKTHGDAKQAPQRQEPKSDRYEADDDIPF